MQLLEHDRNDMPRAYISVVCGFFSVVLLAPSLTLGLACLVKPGPADVHRLECPLYTPRWSDISWRNLPILFLNTFTLVPAICLQWGYWIVLDLWCSNSCYLSVPTAPLLFTGSFVSFPERKFGLLWDGPSNFWGFIVSEAIRTCSCVFPLFRKSPLIWRGSEYWSILEVLLRRLITVAQEIWILRSLWWNPWMCRFP